MKAKLELFPQPRSSYEGGQRRSCLVKHRNEEGVSFEHTVWFDYPSLLVLPEDSDADAYLICALLPAMHLGADIIIYGAVCQHLLANLSEWQQVWHAWCPELYTLVNITATEQRLPQMALTGAIVAFSGGTDAQFTTYRHATAQAGYATQQLKGGVLVHGFDIELSDESGFAGAAHKARTTLSDLTINLIAVKTNIRECWDIYWPHYYGSAVASVLSSLKNLAGSGLIGSGPAYNALFTPCGSHPITDPLLSSSSFKIVHDGAGFSRSQKIALLAKWPTGINNLRVCWTGLQRDRNCGRCEKCIRTQLNFLLAGIENPPCFSSPLTLASFKSLVLHSDGARAEWNLIYQQIKESGVGVQWLKEIEQVIKRKTFSPINSLLPKGSRRRDWAKQMIAGYRK
ncbi:hypothetical protein [Oceanisphaera avium]|uniref:Uncharacterized protein n=1 Tax=Oceanisphaera avium TaxID=1903694 RepID=A0A1Y0CX54_9GAMM|nr:hypothetical protein [Oceanisphaera avium]ART79892.1 hypothetical protein CBP12_06770 [Oceanisphaera avium]